MALVGVPVAADPFADALVEDAVVAAVVKEDELVVGLDESVDAFFHEWVVERSNARHWHSREQVCKLCGIGALTCAKAEDDAVVYEANRIGHEERMQVLWR